MEPISLETRENLKGLTISALQKMRHNGGLEPFDIDYINKSILAKLRSSRDISKAVRYKYVASFIKSILSENQMNSVLSQIDSDFIHESISSI